MPLVEGIPFYRREEEKEPLHLSDERVYLSV